MELAFIDDRDPQEEVGQGDAMGTLRLHLAGFAWKGFIADRRGRFPAASFGSGAMLGDGDGSAAGTTEDSLREAAVPLPSLREEDERMANVRSPSGGVAAGATTAMIAKAEIYEGLLAGLRRTGP